MASMKAHILFITNLFQPEPNHLKGISFIKALMDNGHKVHVLTGFPNYPGGKVYSGYRIRWKQREIIDGVPITRVAMYPSHNQSSVDRSCNYLSLGFSMLANVPWLCEKFDICYVYLGPITLLWPAMWLRQRHGTRIIADVQDIWPESVTGSGMLRSRLLIRAIDVLTHWSYHTVNRFVVLSPGYKSLLVERGFLADRIAVIYNWAEEDINLSLENESYKYFDRSKFNILYSGNFGPLQGLDHVLDAANIAAARGSRCHLVLVGSGVEFDHISDRITNEKIVNAAIFHRISASKAMAIQNKADLLLLHLVRTPLTEIGIPQKVQAYMASGRPIIAAVSGETARLVDEAKCGLLCEPSNPYDIANTILKAENLLPAKLEEMGVRGREFYKKNLGFDHGVEKVKDLISLMMKR
jgi:colanic acid biosynthesis glycosyl transferase WcaI